MRQSGQDTARVTAIAAVWRTLWLGGFLLAALAPPAVGQPLSTEAATCRRTIATGVRRIADYVTAQMIACHKRRMKGTIGAETNCSDADDTTFPTTAAGNIASLIVSRTTKAESSCSASTAAGLGYADCAGACAAEVPVVASIGDAFRCLACRATHEAGAAVSATYGGSPPLLAGSTTAWRCQNWYLGLALQRYARKRLGSQRDCQYDEDRGAIAATDCRAADLDGKIAVAREVALARVAKCSDTDLAALTSCGAVVAVEQSCVVAAAEGVTDSLFDAVFPQPPPTATPTSAPTGTNTATRTPTATASPTPTIDTSCASAHFLNVSSAAGPGGSYATLRPSLSVSCGVSTVVVQSNGIPTYQYVAMTPNGLQAKNYSFVFPRSPSAAAVTTNVPLLGPVGVAVNGIPIYGVNEGAQPTSDAYGDPIAAAILDQCGSHSAQQGTFHNHKLLVKCLLQSAVSSSQPWNNSDPSPGDPSPVVGYSFDGFPIYGPYECTDGACTAVQEMRSSWDHTGYQAGTVGCTSSAACASGYCTAVMIAGVQTTACVPKTCVWSNNTYSAKAGTQYLDRCNGHVGPNGGYHYHTTATFPYTLGCYRGTPSNNGGVGTPPGGTCP